MADRVKPLKWETPDTGTEADQYQTPLNPAEDHVDAAGLFIQRYVGPGEQDHTNDENVHVTRDSSDNMTFKDSANPTPVTLSALTAGGFDINSIVWDLAGGIVYANNEQAVTK